VLPGGTFNTKYESDLAVIRTKWQWVLLGLLLVICFTLPLFPFISGYWLAWFTKVAIVIVAVLGLHILTGLCGQISIGHSAFLGVGAFAVAIFTAKTGMSGWLCLPISVLAAGAIGLFFGLPCFRLKGFYLAISTLAASYIIVWCFEYDKFEPVTGGFSGLALQPLTLGSIDFGAKGSFYVLTLVVLVVATILAKNIQRTATGRAFVAIRDNELAAEVSGIAIFRYKMIAFFIGCMFAGVAGWLFAYSQLRVNPDQFSLQESMSYLGMIIVGGWGSTTGVFFGAFFMELLKIVLSDYINPWLADVLPSAWTQQIYVAMSLIVGGLIVIIFMIKVPRGLYYLWEKIKIYYRVHPYSFFAS